MKIYYFKLFFRKKYQRIYSDDRERKVKMIKLYSLPKLKNFENSDKKNRLALLDS